MYFQEADLYPWLAQGYSVTKSKEAGPDSNSNTNAPNSVVAAVKTEPNFCQFSSTDTRNVLVSEIFSPLLLTKYTFNVVWVFFNHTENS